MISKNGNILEITINGISSTKLGKNFKLVVDGNYTVEASALSYAYSLKSLGERDANELYAKELACALYEYYAASMNYIGETID